MTRAAVWLACALTLFVVIACRSGGGARNDTEIASALLRLLGNETGTESAIFTGKLPPDLRSALNPDLAADAAGASAKDALAIPVHPKGRLIGSARQREPNGTITFFLLYSVEQSDRDVADAVAKQLDQTPWQIVGGQVQEAATVYSFHSTASGDIQGTAVVQPLPGNRAFPVVLRRDGKDRTVQLARDAAIPILHAEFDTNGGHLTVQKAAASLAAQGVRNGDELRRIGDRDVTDLASLNDALHALRAADKPQRAAITYVVQIAAALDVQSGGVPSAHALPPGFPAPFLVLDGMIVAAAQWQQQPGIAAYQVTLLTKQSQFDAIDALHEAIGHAAGWQAGADSAQGLATVLHFKRADGTATGSATIDLAADVPGYVSVTVQLQSGTTGTGTRSN